jgi:ubiquinone/menaquinone biosynthesis C-methylase UbiE
MQPREIARREYEVVGLDTFEEMLQYLRKKQRKRVFRSNVDMLKNLDSVATSLKLRPFSSIHFKIKETKHLAGLQSSYAFLFLLGDIKGKRLKS